MRKNSIYSADAMNIIHILPTLICSILVGCNLQLKCIVIVGWKMTVMIIVTGHLMMNYWSVFSRV